MKYWSFPKGGIDFSDPSAPSADSVRIACLPGISVIPLEQGGGDSLIALVDVGDRVREGMVVARSRDGHTAHVHASVPGRVTRLAAWKGPGGEKRGGMVVRMEGSFEFLGKREILHPWENLSPAELRQLAAHYGIVEMEGEGKPVLASVPPGDGGGGSLVIRCVFDDPWLVADRVLCRERLQAVVEGSFIAAKAGGQRRLVFAVSKEEARLGRELLAAASGGAMPAFLVMVGSRYPQRNRRELELVLRAWEKHEGLLLGALEILGPSTLAALRDAVVLRKPVLERYVAVGGAAVRQPAVIRARIGTRLGELFAECGGFLGPPDVIATGSPFLCRPVLDLDEPVTKTSAAVFALPAGEGKQSGNPGDAESHCISCGECRAVCPVGFDPEELCKRHGSGIQTAAAGTEPAISSTGPDGDSSRPRCHGCGCCEMVCPSRIPLSSILMGIPGVPKQGGGPRLWGGAGKLPRRPAGKRSSAHGT